MLTVNIRAYHDPSRRYGKYVWCTRIFFLILIGYERQETQVIVSSFFSRKWLSIPAILFFFLHISKLSVGLWPWVIAVDLQNPTCINVQRVTRQYFGRSATRETLAPKHRNTDSATRSTFPLPSYFRFFPPLIAVISPIKVFSLIRYIN